ncbi:hypothetical protein A2U01_0118876, partial [Trifolium medium]|nr:hypothetical protein [Trifolium medium]
MGSRRARWDLAGRESSLLLARNLKIFCLYFTGARQAKSSER